MSMSLDGFIDFILTRRAPPTRGRGAAPDQLELLIGCPVAA